MASVKEITPFPGTAALVVGVGHGSKHASKRPVSRRFGDRRAVAVSHDVTSRPGVPDLLVRERWHVAIGKGQIGCDQKARIA